MTFAVLAWSDCTFSFEGLSYNLYKKNRLSKPRFLYCRIAENCIKE